MSHHARSLPHVVSDNAKILILKQITTVDVAAVNEFGLCLIMQRY